jgi:hypothetical protein
MLVALIAGLEAMVVYAARSKQGRERRKQLLMGTSRDLVRAIPIVDEYFNQKTAGASSFQRFIASKLVNVCRRLSNTRSFEFLLLHLIRQAMKKRRNKSVNMKRRVML